MTFAAPTAEVFMNRLLFPLTLALALAGCSDYAISPEDGDLNDTDVYGTDTGNSENPDDDADPEDENDFLALRPSETDTYVFVANPARNTVTRVNVLTLEVRTTEVGADPNAVLITPDNRTVAVFNRGDDSVSVLNTETLEGIEIPVRDDFNKMVMSPDGLWVALWHDVGSERPDDPPPSGIQSYNEVSFVNLATHAHFPMAVDYQPREIQFTPDGTLATVVTATSLGIVDLTEATLSPRLVSVTDELVDPPTAEEVVIAPDGSYAFVRQFGAEDLVIVDLTTEVVERVPVGTNPTDLDLTPDGLRAVVVSRGSHELHVFEVADPFVPPEILDLPPDVNLGSVIIDPTGRRALLYTTAGSTDRFATWDLESGDITLRSLVKPVASMAITPTGDSLLVFHTKEDAVGADTNSPFYGEWALTLISLSDFRQNPLKLPAEPIGFANSNNGHFGYFIMKNQDFLERLNYSTLLPDEIPLRSHPVYVGVLPDLTPNDGDEPQAWVSQEHDLGRMSFYDPDDNSLETITGFELNAAVEE